MKHTLAILTIALCALAAQAATPEAYYKWGTHNPDGVQVRFNAGYALGGTTPLPLPAEIRKIDRFKPYGGGNIGVEASKMFGASKKRWGISGGLHGFLDGMKTGAHVKGYHMGLDLDGNHVEGYFTGIDETNVRLIGLTLPLQAVWRVSPRWTLQAGPYFQIFKKKEFEGCVYDGYLREVDPTGAKIDIPASNPLPYDFSSDLRSAYWGITLTADWKITRHLSAYGAVDWGVSDVFRSNYETITFSMHSIYANIGLAYNIF